MPSGRRALEPRGAADTLGIMPSENHQFDVNTRGHTEVINITERVAAGIQSGRIRNGVATVFVVGSTAGITTTEFEPGLVQRDLKVAFEKIAPQDAEYLHEQTWNDDNGHSHVRASLLGPSLAVPIVDGRMPLGTWQQIVLIDFDTRPRTRRIIVQTVGD
jgi:secondary thiamine-phosphate synthase enzyme